MMDKRTPLTALRPTWASQKAREAQERTLLLIRRGVWLYFLLLIFEGALRKWVFPEFATPLLIIRDPIALILLAIAYDKGIFPASRLMQGIILIGILSFFLSITIGHGNLFVAFYGLRILIIHLPFMFLVGKILTHENVIQIGKVILCIAIPMTVLIALQFYSSQSAWVNRGIGGDMEGAGFSGAMGYQRPPGTFSFTNGISLFYGLLAPFVIYFWLRPHSQPILRATLIAATISLLAAIPLSISRTLFFEVIVSLAFALLIVAKRPRMLGSILLTVLALMILIGILSNFTFFQTATNVFSARFKNANESEGGLEGFLIDRFLGGMYQAIFGENEIQFWGYGLGMGTNVGAVLMSGKRAFLIAEGEWGRIIGEMGMLLGSLLIYLRVAIAIQLGFKSYQQLAVNNILPWLILSFTCLNVMQGQWAQPTSLGFAVVSGGLVIASLKKAKRKTT